MRRSKISRLFFFYLLVRWLNLRFPWCNYLYNCLPHSPGWIFWRPVIRQDVRNTAMTCFFFSQVVWLFPRDFCWAAQKGSLWNGSCKLFGWETFGQTCWVIERVVAIDWFVDEDDTFLLLQLSALIALFFLNRTRSSTLGELLVSGDVNSKRY